MEEEQSPDIHSVLKETCTFLRTVNKHLPKKFQPQAENLIRKSITVTQSTFKSEYYIDMDPKNARNGSLKNAVAIPAFNEYLEGYTKSLDTSEYENPDAVSDVNVSKTIINSEECPYSDIPYSEAKEKSPTKVGTLDKKRKYLNIFCPRKFKVIIKNNWLLLYLGKDGIPTEYLNLSKYKITSGAANEKYFEINDNDKSHIFWAKSLKEKNEWVEAINNCSGKKRSLGDIFDNSLPQNRQLPLIPTENALKPKIPVIIKIGVYDQPDECKDDPKIYSSIYTPADIDENSGEYAQVSLDDDTFSGEQNYSDCGAAMSSMNKIKNTEASTYETIEAATVLMPCQNHSYLHKT